jgi:peptidoglycan/xylan/chitin deacetylase (PgdA/CDA1 family)
MAPLWRAPYGECNAEILRWAADDGWTHVGWTRDERGRRSLDSLDWVDDPGSRLYLSSARLVDRLLAFGEGGAGLNGGVVLMHLATRASDPAVDRLAGLIDTLRARGYRLVTVSELLREAGIPAAPPVATAALAR